MKEYKIGTKIKIKSLNNIRKAFNETNGEFTPNKFKSLYINDIYAKYCNTIATIIQTRGNNTFYPYTLEMHDTSIYNYSEREFKLSIFPISFKPLY